MRSLVTAGAPAIPSQSSTVQGTTTERSEVRIWVNVLLTLPFLVFFYVQLAHHALWRDELNAFGIAAGSPTLRSLLANVRYEGHPWLWYVLLWFVSKLTHDPVGMKWLQAVIGTGIYLVLGLLSPFRWWEKLLIFLSYYVIFEYTVMCRMYGLVFLFALLYCRERTRTPQRLILSAIYLGLMASADATGILLSFAFVLEGLSLGKSLRPQGRMYARALAFYGLAVSVSIWSMILPKDRGMQDHGAIFGSPIKYHLIKSVLNCTVVTFVPTFVALPAHFWSATAEQHFHYFAALLPVAAALYWLCIRDYRSLQWLGGSILVFMIAFGYVVYAGSPRHFGMIFIALLGGFWFLRSMGKPIPWAGLVLLAPLVFAGLQASISSWRRPFSNAKNAASWIRSRGLQNTPLIGYPDFAAIGVAEELDRPLYAPECQCQIRFVRFSSARVSSHFENAAQDLSAEQGRSGQRALLLIASYPLTPTQILDLHSRGVLAQSLQMFTGAEVWAEDFYLYRLRTQ